LPLQQNVSEGNTKKCDDLLHLATSLEISSTRTRGCLVLLGHKNTFCCRIVL
jgi:hypothetical protein